VKILTNGFAVIVLDEYGRIVDHAIPMDMPLNILKEATALSFDIYRVIETIVKQLGYSMPRYINLKLDNYEVTVFNRFNRIVIAVFYSSTPTIPVVKKESEAIVEH